MAREIMAINGKSWARDLSASPAISRTVYNTGTSHLILWRRQQNTPDEVSEPGRHKSEFFSPTRDPDHSIPSAHGNIERTFRKTAASDHAVPRRPRFVTSAACDPRGACLGGVCLGGDRRAAGHAEDRAPDTTRKMADQWPAIQ
jgi:hypothetical protein